MIYETSAKKERNVLWKLFMPLLGSEYFPIFLFFHSRKENFYFLPVNGEKDNVLFRRLGRIDRILAADAEQTSCHPQSNLSERKRDPKSTKSYYRNVTK